MFTSWTWAVNIYIEKNLLWPHVYIPFHTYTLVNTISFPPRVSMVPQMRSTSIFMSNARVPGIDRQMLPSTCPFMLLLNSALTHTGDGIQLTHTRASIQTTNMNPQINISIYNRKNKK